MVANNQRFHSLNFVILPALFLISIFCANNIWQYLIILNIAYFNLLLIARPIKYRILIIFILCLIPVLSAVFLSSYFFAEAANTLSKIYTAQLLTTRYFSLAVISFAFAIHTPFPLVFDYLIKNKILSVKIGYAILAAFNSFYFLGEEFQKTQNAYKMRYGRNYISPSVFIALLSAAARYAHNLSISMYSRGINNQKTFVNSIANLKPIDYFLYLINLVGVILLQIYFL